MVGTGIRGLGLAAAVALAWVSGCNSAEAFEGALQDPSTTLGMGSAGDGQGNGQGRGRHRGDGMGQGGGQGGGGQQGPGECQGGACRGEGSCNGPMMGPPDPLMLPECRMMGMGPDHMGMGPRGQGCDGGNCRMMHRGQGPGRHHRMGPPPFPGMCPPPEGEPPPMAPGEGPRPVTDPSGRPLPPFAFIYDANDDGVLQEEEHATLREDLGVRCQARHALMLQRFDGNQDGTLDQAEREAARAAMQATAEGWVREHDLDGNGCLSPQEHHAAMQGADLATFDADHDGTLNAAEKTALRAAMRERFRSGLMPFER